MKNKNSRITTINERENKLKKKKMSSNSFYDWLNKNQVKCDHVEIFDFADTGRGMVKQIT